LPRGQGRWAGPWPRSAFPALMFDYILTGPISGFRRDSTSLD
jgi:hypothetical protein